VLLTKYFLDLNLNSRARPGLQGSKLRIRNAEGYYFHLRQV